MRERLAPFRTHRILPPTHKGRLTSPYHGISMIASQYICSLLTTHLTHGHHEPNARTLHHIIIAFPTAVKSHRSTHAPNPTQYTLHTCTYPAHARFPLLPHPNLNNIPITINGRC